MNHAAAILGHTLKLGKLRQIGFIVENIENSVSRFSSDLGIGSWYRANIVDQEITYRGKRSDVSLDFAFTFLGTTQIELIATDPKEDNFYAEFLRSRGEGIQHFGFITSSMKKTLKRIEHAGHEVIQHARFTTKTGSVTKCAFLDTFESCGFYTEILETRLMGLPVGQSRILMKMGNLLGDTEKISYKK